MSRHQSNRNTKHELSDQSLNRESNKTVRTPAEAEQFINFGLSPRVVAALPGFIRSLYDVQKQVIPAAMRGENIVGLAPTGEGKTFAYGLSLFERILRMPQPVPASSAIIVVPSAQLAQQVYRELLPVARAIQIQVGYFVEQRGKRNVAPSGSAYPIPKAVGSVQVAIGTPAALQQAGYRGEVLFENTSLFVLDEADYLLGRDMAMETEALQNELRPYDDRQTLLFSATLPIEVVRRMSEVVPGGRVIDTGIERPLDRIVHQVALTGGGDPDEVLLEVLMKERVGRGMVFCSTVEECMELADYLRRSGIKAESMSREIEPLERIKIVKSLSEGRIHVLVATSEMARGLDIFGLTHVVNSGVPFDASEYIQQAGRTARRGEQGKCITVVSPVLKYEFDTMMAILKLKVEPYPIVPRVSKRSFTRVNEQVTPQVIIDEIQARCEYTFESPGLILTSMNRNSRSCAARESAPLLNLVGRKASVLIRSSSRYIANSSGSKLPRDVDLDGKVFSQRELKLLLDYCGLSRLVADDKAPGVGFTQRVSNTEQAVYNLFGAFLVDTGDLKGPTSIVAAALGIQSLLVVGNERIRTRHVSGAGVTPKAFEELQKALGYRFNSFTLLGAAISGSFTDPQKSSGSGLSARISSNPIFRQLGASALELYVVDSLRRSFLGSELGFIGDSEASRVTDRQAPSYIRNQTELILRLGEVWQRAEFATLDRAFTDVFGRSPLDDAEMGNTILLKLLGALYLDGGYEKCCVVFDRLFPVLKERAEIASQSLLTAFHPAQLQECLTEAGEVRERRIAAQRRAIEGQRRAESFKVSEKVRSTEEVVAPQVDFARLLEDEVKSRELGKLKVSTVQEHGEEKYTTRVLVAKREIASATSNIRKESITEACKIALGRIVDKPHN